MTVEAKKTGSELILILAGRLDTTTSPALEQEIETSIDGITSLRLDFTNLQYVSSAGLRVLMSANKLMSEQGEMDICGVSDEVMEIFEITGFSDVLKIS
jgi:anti-sigma B factor antagonist